MEYASSAMKTVLKVVMVQIQTLVPVVALHANMLMMNQIVWKNALYLNIKI